MIWKVLILLEVSDTRTLPVHARSTVFLKPYKVPVLLYLVSNAHKSTATSIGSQTFLLSGLLALLAVGDLLKYALVPALALFVFAIAPVGDLATPFTTLWNDRRAKHP